MFASRPVFIAKLNYLFYLSQLRLRRPLPANLFHTSTARGSSHSLVCVSIFFTALRFTDNKEPKSGSLYYQTIQTGHTSPVSHPRMINQLSAVFALSSQIDICLAVILSFNSHIVPLLNAARTLHSMPFQPSSALMKTLLFYLAHFFERNELRL